MPAKNIYHDAVIAALVADGWTITDDPLGVVIGARRLYVDVGAERAALGAERDGERIAVEVQSFLRRSDLDRAVGQYAVYRSVLRELVPERPLFLAVTDEAYAGILSEPIGQLVVEDVEMKLVVFDPTARRILQWRN